MARCEYCGETILFGGVKDAGKRFCNKRCYTTWRQEVKIVVVHEDEVAHHLLNVFDGDCPVCGGRGPVDIRKAYWIWSFAVLTSWQQTAQLSCKGCGMTSNMKALAFSGLLGWWGIPFGMIVTPIMVVRNVLSILAIDKDAPSEDLESVVRLALAQNVPIDAVLRNARARK